MNRISSLDAAKFFSIFFIIVIHTQPLLHDQTSVLVSDIGSFINVFTRFAVPLFFMISGYLLYEQGQDKGASYFLGYIIKIFKFYALGCAFYFLFDVLFELPSFLLGQKSLYDVLQAAAEPYLNVMALYYGPYHLWFLTALAYSSFAVAVFAKFNRVGMLVLLSLCLFLLGLFGQSYQSISSFSLPVQTRDALFFGMFSLALGYWMAQKRLIERVKISPMLLIAACIVLCVLQFAEWGVLKYIFSAKLGNYYIFTIPLCFVLLMWALSKKDFSAGTFMEKAGKRTLGIFLIHPAFIRIINSISEEFPFEESIAWQLLFPVIVFYLSYVSCELISRLVPAKVKRFF